MEEGSEWESPWCCLRFAKPETEAQAEAEAVGELKSWRSVEEAYPIFFAWQYECDKCVSALLFALLHPTIRIGCVSRAGRQISLWCGGGAVEAGFSNWLTVQEAIQHLSKGSCLSDLRVLEKDERKGRTNAETALKEGR